VDRQPSIPPTIDDQLFDAARAGDVEKLTRLLDAHPDKLLTRDQPYEHTLLHVASFAGHLNCVDLLLERGIDVNVREKGDNTCPMHWAAAAARLDVVRRLADAGGDVVGHGDDHELEVIGWATCWDEAHDDAHRAVATFLVSRGARHHIFSAIALNLGDEVRRIVSADPDALRRKMSHNENHQLPLHFAVRMNRPGMVELLLELGADPAAGDASGVPALQYAATPKVDPSIIEALTRGGPANLFSALVLRDEKTAARLMGEHRSVDGALHLAAKRGDVWAVRWLLDHGADPNARWDHWGALVTPLHLAALSDQAAVVPLLLDAHADTTIRDSMHDSDVLGWAEFFGHDGIVTILKAHRSRS